MPVETLAAFVAEQSLEIATGAAVVAVVLTIPAAANGSVTKTGYVIYEKVAGGAQWYGGWSLTFPGGRACE